MVNNEELKKFHDIRGLVRVHYRAQHPPHPRNRRCPPIRPGPGSMWFRLPARLHYACIFLFRKN